MILKILKITNENFKDREFEEIDELIYEFNSGGIKISNWIEFKIFCKQNYFFLCRLSHFSRIYNFLIFFFSHQSTFNYFSFKCSIIF